MSANLLPKTLASDISDELPAMRHILSVVHMVAVDELVGIANEVLRQPMKVKGTHLSARLRCPTTELRVVAPTRLVDDVLDKQIELRRNSGLGLLRRCWLAPIFFFPMSVDAFVEEGRERARQWIAHKDGVKWNAILQQKSIGGIYANHVDSVLVELILIVVVRRIMIVSQVHGRSLDALHHLLPGTATDLWHGAKHKRLKLVLCALRAIDVQCTAVALCPME